MQRWTFNSTRNTFYWCDWIIEWDMFYTIFTTLYENIKKDEMFSKIQTNENINEGGRPNLRFIVEALKDLVRYIRGETNTELRPTKKHEVFDQTNAAILEWNGQNSTIKEAQKEMLKENILKTPLRRNINEDIFPQNKDMHIRTAYLKTVLRMKVQEEQTFVAIQGHVYLIEEKYAQFIRECQWKNYTKPSGKILELPSSETMTCQHQQQLDREPIKPEMDIQEENIKKDGIRTSKKLRKKNAGKLNELTEVTCTGSKMDRRGILEEYKNGNEEYGKLGNICRKNPFSKATIKRRHKGATKRFKPTKRYDMLLQVFYEICSLGQRLSMMQKIVLCIFICAICPVIGLDTACSASISTKKIVTECPNSVEDSIKRACEMNCDKKKQNCTLPENFQYHCLPTEDRNVFVEVCAPVKFISCHCAMYDTTAGIVQTDNESRFTGIMENCTYYSNMFHAKGCRGIFEAINSTEEFPYISMTCSANYESNKTENTNMDSFEENNSAYIAVVAAVVVVVIFVGVIAVLLKRCLMRKLAARERRDNDEEDPNNQELNLMEEKHS